MCPSSLGSSDVWSQEAPSARRCSVSSQQPPSRFPLQCLGGEEASGCPKEQRDSGQGWQAAPPREIPLPLSGVFWDLVVSSTRNHGEVEGKP